VDVYALALKVIAFVLIQVSVVGYDNLFEK
jgi:hypothetical protein